MSRRTDLLIRAAAGLAAVAAAAAPAGADDDARAGAGEVRGHEVIVVEGEGPRGGVGDLTGAAEDARDRRAALAEPPFVTRIHVDERAGEAATLAEVLAASAGTHVRSLGGLGSFSSISVRGASPGHTTVLVDGVPLSRVASVTTDLGRLELDAFEEIDLYRGGVPVALGGAALGGALALETRLGPTADGARLRLSAGIGSFGARHLRARWGGGDPADGVAATVAVGYAGAAGDFRYFDDRGTNLVRDDDGWETRRNNDYDHVDLVARAGGAAGAGRAWAAGARALGRRQGLPGAAYRPAMQPRLDTASVLADAALVDEAVAPDLATRAHGWVLVERQRFVDPAAEVSLAPEDRRYRTVAAGASSAWTLGVGRHRAALAVDGRVDRFADEDRRRGGLRVAGGRLAAGVAVADDVALAGGRWVIEPALRLDVMRTDPITDLDQPGMVEAPARTDLAPSPRVSTRALVHDDVAIKASAGWYWRAPTVAELYGDRGFLVGTPDLRPERGPSVDAGIVVAPARGRRAVDRVLVEAAAFASWPRDTIALVTTGALVARPINAGDARLAGVEASATARLARAVTLAANYTFLATEQRRTEPSFEGKPLPQRPRHAAWARADVARTWRGRTGVVWADVAWVAGNYLDQAARNEVPARRLVGAGVKLEVGGGVLVGVEVKNLLDARVEHVPLDPAPRPDLATVPRAIADVGGYPLPGRALYLAVEWRR